VNTCKLFDSTIREAQHARRSLLKKFLFDLNFMRRMPMSDGRNRMEGFLLDATEKLEGVIKSPRMTGARKNAVATKLATDYTMLVNSLQAPQA
jgi:hypothetical protein